MQHLLEYFTNEIIYVNEKNKLNDNHKNKIRFIYSFAILFIILLICSFFNIL
jgi:hypothetical protein